MFFPLAVQAQLQLRLLEGQQRISAGGCPIDPVTGLLIQTIIADQSLFPPLECSTPAPETPTPAPQDPSPDRVGWAARVSQPRLDLFPSLQESSSVSPTVSRHRDTQTTPKISGGAGVRQSHPPQTIRRPVADPNRQNSSRSSVPLRTRNNDDECSEDEAAEYLTSNRRGVVLDERWDGIDAALEQIEG